MCVFKKPHANDAKEYIDLQNDPSNDLQEVLFSPLYTPEHNGIADCISRTMLEAAKLCSFKPIFQSACGQVHSNRLYIS